MSVAGLPDRWWHASGGVRYHLRAWRYRRSLWAPFIDTALRWQAAWQPAASTLVLIGPSAGYSLSAQLLSRFAQVVALEPDPLARWLLTRRFPDVNWHFPSPATRIDVFAPDGLHTLAACWPHAAILFANVIGQRLTDDTASAWQSALRAQLAAHNWASYHDVISTHQTPRHTQAFALNEPATLEDVLGRFWAGGELALHDHLTFRLLPEARDYALWSLTPQQHHLIEWVTHTAQETGGHPSTAAGQSAHG